MSRKYSIWSAVAAGLLSALICTVVQSCGGRGNDTVKAAESERFKLIDSYKSLTSEIKVFVDNDTGVQYLMYKSGYGVGVTVMVDADGNPLVKEWRKVNENGHS